MPWELRNGRRYYDSVERVNGEPRRVYRGTGSAGRRHELLTCYPRQVGRVERQGAGSAGRRHELLTCYPRRQRAKVRAAAVARKAEIIALKSATRRVLDMIRHLVRAARLAGGEYQHHGQWRKRGNFLFTRSDMLTMTPPPEVNELAERLLELNDRANRGDRSALTELEDLLDRHPLVWRTAARLSADTAGGWARLLGDGGPVTEACLRREVANWKAGLAGPDPTPAIHAAVDAAAVAWLAQCFAQRVLHAAPPNKRPAALEKVAAANRQLQRVIRLVMDARAADAAVTLATADSATATSGLRLFGGTG